MNELIPFALDKIQCPESLTIKTFDKENFPFDQFDIVGFLKPNEIIKVADLLIAALKMRVSESKIIDVRKFLYNQYSKDSFVNNDFYDLLASVFDYLEQVSGKIIDSRIINNPALLNKAIEATLDAATVLLIKRYPLITRILNKHQKGEIETLTNKTVNNVNILESNRDNTGSKNRGTNMNDMMKMMMMSKMMNKGESKMDPMLMMSMMNNGSDNSQMKNMMLYQAMNKGGSSDPMKMYLMSQMMKKKKAKETDSNSSKGSKIDPMTMLSMMQKGSGGSSMDSYGGNLTATQLQTYMMNKAMGGGSSNNKSTKSMMMEMMMKKAMGGGSSNNNSVQSMMMNQMMGNSSQMDMYRMMLQMKNGGNNNSRLNSYSQDPNLAEQYAELLGERSGVDHQMEAMNKRAKIMAKMYEEETDDLPWEEEESVCATPSYNQWLDDDEEEEEGAVTYSDDYREEHAHLFEMFDTDSDSELAIEDKEIIASHDAQTGKDKWVANVREGQLEVINKYFKGKVPAGVKIKNIDDAPYFIFTPDQLFSGSYQTLDTLNYYFAKGEAPPASAAALPLTVKGKQMLVSILTADGDRADIIIPLEKGTEVNIEDHIPPKAIMKWRKLREETIYDDTGTAINDHVVVVQDEIVGTANSASITANCYALASEDIDLGNNDFRPIEYSTNDPVGFYVEDSKAILDRMGDGTDITNIPSFVKAINEDENLHSGIKAYIDSKGTDVINDFLLYSMGVNVKIDSFLKDYIELETYLSEKEDSTLIDYLRKSQVQLARDICNAIVGDDVSGIDIPVITMSQTETVDGKEVTKEVEVNGMNFDGNLVVFNNRRQITELPWTYDQLGLTLIKQLNKADPFVLLTKDENNEDIYNAVQEITERSKVDGLIRKVDLITKDRIILSIIQSAYDEHSFILVARKS